jgi:hypothetical protein
MPGNKFVQLRNSLHTVVEPCLGQEHPGVILQFDIVVLFGPIVTQEQQSGSPRTRSNSWP